MSDQEHDIVNLAMAEKPLHQKFVEEFGVNEKFAIEATGWFEENFEVPVKNITPVTFKVSLDKIFTLMVNSENPKLAIRLMAYALHLDEAVKFGYPTLFARECGCTKANATKTLKEIQSKLGLPPRASQRSKAARKKMSDKRKGQCNK